MHRHALTAGYLYQAALRAELTRRVGVGWTTPVRGVTEITGVPAKVRRLEIPTERIDAALAGSRLSEDQRLATAPRLPSRMLRGLVGTVAPKAPSKVAGLRL